jgi:hypothetical protein
MSGYVRVDTSNNIADGNVINSADLDNEFDGVQAAFNSSTGHVHDGTSGNGAPITKIGPVQDVVVSISSMYPKTTNTVDLGTSSLKYKDLYLAGNASVAGTLAVTGVATFTAQPILSSLTASRAVFSDGSKGLVSNAITGTGDVVMSTSPTLVTPILGTPTSATLTNATGLPIGTGVSGLGTGVATALAVNIGSAGAPVLFNGALGTPSSGTVTNLTGTASININGTVGATTASTGAFTTLTTSSTVTHNGGTANGVAYLNGSKVLTTGSALVFDGTNLGVGVTPSAWGSSYIALQNGTFSIARDGTNNDLSSNRYVNSGGTSTYIANGYASMMRQVSGAFNWFNAASGTAGNAITFTQAMTLDASGNLGIGKTSPTAPLSFADTAGTAGTANKISLYWAAGETYALYGFGVSANKLDYVSGDSHVFYRRVSNTSTESMRIDSSGNLLVGQTSTGLQAARSFSFQGVGDGSCYVSHSTANASGDSYIQFGYNATKIGSITQSGTTAVLYNTTSDQRLKENIVDADSASSLIDSLQVRQFDWITDKTHQRYGFVAQELVTVAPEAVNQPTNPDEMMAVDYSKLVPMLVKEIQSLRQRLAAANI